MPENAGLPGRAFSRLYAILDLELTAARGLSAEHLLDAWLSAGVRLIQLRTKTTPSGRLLELADALVEKASAAGATFIVNDRADIAHLSGAAGVHVGQTDLTPSDARLVVGTTAIVGVSTHNDAQVRAAFTAPVDYVAIGPVFTTSSKERPDPVVGLDGVRRARELVAATNLPIVAIGGIRLEQAAAVVDAGAAVIAVISDLLTSDPEARARAFLDALA